MYVCVCVCVLIFGTENKRDRDVPDLAHFLALMFQAKDLVFYVWKLISFREKECMCVCVNVCLCLNACITPIGGQYCHGKEEMRVGLWSFKDISMSEVCKSGRACERKKSQHEQTLALRGVVGVHARAVVFMKM